MCLAISLSLILLSRFFARTLIIRRANKCFMHATTMPERELQCSCGQTRYLRIICTSIIVGLFLRNAPSSILVLCTNSCCPYILCERDTDRQQRKREGCRSMFNRLTKWSLPFRIGLPTLPPSSAMPSALVNSSFEFYLRIEKSKGSKSFS